MTKSKERATGCTLDYNNLTALATMWGNMVNIKLVAAVKVHVEDKNCQTYQTLKQHDPNLLRFLQTWTQSTKIIADELVERLQELQKIIKENPEEYTAYVRATQATASEPVEGQTPQTPESNNP